MSIATEKKSKDGLHYLIILFFMAVFGFIPPFSQMTPTGMKILGIFIGVLYGWSTVGILRPTLLAIFFYGLTVGFTNFLQASFGNFMVAMMLLLLPMMGMLSKYNVLGVLAQKFVTVKFCEGHPWRLCFMIMVGAWVCVNFNSIVAAIIFVTFIKNIAEVANIPLKSPWPTAMTMGVAMTLLVGQMQIPVFGTPLVLIGALQSITGLSINYMKYILFIVPLGFALMFMYILCMRYVLKIDVSPLKAVTAESMGGKVLFNSDQKKALIVMVLMIAMLLCTQIFPKGSMLNNIFSVKFGTFGIALGMCCLIPFIKNSEGKPLFDFNDCASQGMAWEPFFLVAFIIPFSGFMTGGDTGISATLTSLMKPMFKLSPMIFMILMFALMNFITNFAQNTVVAIIFMPLFFAYGQATGANMEGAYILLFIISSMAVASPASSTLCGVMYSVPEAVDLKLTMKYAIKVLPILYVFLMLVGLPYANILF